MCTNGRSNSTTGTNSMFFGLSTRREFFAANLTICRKVTRFRCMDWSSTNTAALMSAMEYIAARISMTASMTSVTGFKTKGMTFSSVRYEYPPILIARLNAPKSSGAKITTEISLYTISNPAIAFQL